MPQFRKKPVVIEAFRLTEETRTDNRDWPEWLNAAWNTDVVRTRAETGKAQIGAVAPYERVFPGSDEFPGSLAIVTLEGIHRCNIGDWIIRGVKGELYPCKPEIFDATYDPV